MKLNIKLLPKQLIFINSQAKEIMFSGGIGSGKSKILCYAAFREACKPNNEVLLIRKTLVSLKKSTLISLIGGADPVIPRGCYNLNKAENTIEINGGGIIYLMGMDEPTRIRSMNLGCVCIDEAIEFTEDEYLELTYRLRNQYGDRKIYLATNPGNPSPDNWLYKRFFINKNDRQEVITATSFENRHLPQDFFDSFIGLDEQRKKRMLEGQWVAYDNLVFPNFNRNVQVKDIELKGYESYLMALDWGQSHPMALLVAGIRGPRINIIAEYCEKDMLIDKIRSIVKNVHDKHDNLTILYDPSAKIIYNDLINIGIQLTKANNDVSVGLNRVRNKLSNGTLFIHPSCENLIREIEGYQFKPGTEVVKKVGDDLCDCLRYITNEVEDQEGQHNNIFVLAASDYEQDADPEDKYFKQLV